MSNMENETWKPLILNEKNTGYSISDRGGVKNKKGKMVGHINHQGYMSFYLNKKSYKIHRMVLSTFNPIENMENFHVHHKDGIKTNNRKENLEWIEPSKHALLEIRKGKCPLGKRGKESLSFKGLIGQFNKHGTLVNILEGRKSIEELNFWDRCVYASTRNRLKTYKNHIFRRFPKEVKPEIGKKYNLYDPIFSQFFYKEKENNTGYKQLQLQFL